MSRELELLLFLLALRVGFYHAKCPVAEDVVLGEMRMILEEDPTLAPSLHRMHYHDCFVQGCDVSIMLRSRSGKGERDATPNRSMRGYDAINQIKERLESICPLTAAPHRRRPDRRRSSDQKKGRGERDKGERGEEEGKEREDDMWVPLVSGSYNTLFFM
uniref:OSJNBb0040D15.6 protein n=1 Tax=Oryza sativa subsp. japonica TaxID=39947 RepID=Q7XMW8_ORYSJ|nr:OSJNBb0040D15.6 [Oryza sativa Japonica Group]